MRQIKKCRPAMEGLETREVLSTVAHHGALVHPLTTSQGALSGSYSTGGGIPDTGHTYTLDGTGKALGLSGLKVAGTINQSGFVAIPTTTGTLKLTNSHGTVILNIKADKPASFAPLPTQYHYTVASGTGSYHGLKSAGMLTLALTPGKSPDPFTSVGSFKMTLKHA